MRIEGARFSSEGADQKFEIVFKIPTAEGVDFGVAQAPFFAI